MSRAGEFRTDRAELFRNPTETAADAHWRKYGFQTESREVALALTHRARLQWLGATDGMLAESQRWLKDHGFLTRLRGGSEPLSPVMRDFRRVERGMAPLAAMRESRR